MKRLDIRLDASFWFFAAAALSVFFGGGTADFLIAVLVHEAGHLAAIALLSGGRMEISLKAGGVYIHPRYRRILSAAEDAAILLAGPSAGILTAFAAKKIGFKRLSLTLSLVNLLPVRGTDGGSLLRIFVKKEKAAAVIEALALLLAVIWSLLPALLGGEIRYVFMAVLLAIWIRGTIKS